MRKGTRCGLLNMDLVDYFVWHWLRSIYNKQPYYSRLRWILCHMWWPETGMQKNFFKCFLAFYYGIFKHTEKLRESYSKQLKPTI